MRIWSLLVISYTLLAIAWWSILLFQKSEEIFELQLELAKSPNDIEVIQDSYNLQRKMIIGEGIFITFALIIGFSLIHKSYDREIKSATNQKNFLLSITHELKSPLASIKLALETIRKRDLSKKQMEGITHSALSETNRLSRLIENLLNATNLEYLYEPVLEKTSGENLIKAIEEFNAVHKDRISYSVSGDRESFYLDLYGYAIIADNLIENAAKYSEGQILFNVDVSKKYCIISVADFGNGIPVEERKNITKRFYRIGSEETRKSKGTGLGLFIVYKLVKINKGQLLIKDNVPKGTIFEVKLPIYENSIS